VQSDLTGGDVFIYVKRYRQSITLLFWENGSLLIYYKKMDNGSFEVPPFHTGGEGRHISEIHFLQVICGIEFQKGKQIVRRRTITLALKL